MDYDNWAVERLIKGDKCRAEKSMSCIPLRDDPLCRSCFEGEQENGSKSADMAKHVLDARKLVSEMFRTMPTQAKKDMYLKMTGFLNQTQKIYEANDE